MAHPAKRRRLDTPLPQFSDDDGIALFEGDNEALDPEVRDRIAARNRFKSVLEGIFEKYGQDFTGVGDEIDLKTGKLVVDNGHLKRMEDEGDVGGRLGSSEDELDPEDDSDGSLLNDPRLGPQDGQEWDEQPLESLILDSVVKQGSRTTENRKTKLLSQAQDPKWRIPDLPGITFGSESYHKSETQDAAHNRGLTGPNKPKSPARSLWKHARSSKSYERMPLHPSRRQNIWHGSSRDQENGISGFAKTIRPQEVYDSDVSYTQVHDFKTGPPQRLGPKAPAITGAEKRAAQKEDVALLVRTGEWTVSEEQQLIRYRLNTSLSYTALASKFSGKTAAMVKHRWRYLKRKIIELPTTTTTTRTATSFREVGMHRGNQKHSGTQGELHNGLLHPQNGTIKLSSFEKEQRSFNEPLQHSKDQMESVINSQQQCFGHDISSNMPSENGGQSDELYYPLQAFTFTNEATGNHSLLGEQQQLSNDAWNAFPMVDQMQAIDNDENGEDLDQMWRTLAGNFDATWQNHTPEALAPPFLVPYGSIGLKNSFAYDQNNSYALQGVQVTPCGDTINTHQNVPQSDNVLTVEADLLRVGHDGDDSRTASSTFDLMTLASDIGIQANYTPESSRTLAQLPCSLHPGKTGNVITCHACSMQQPSTRQAANHYPVLAGDSEARVTLQSTIRDTQDQSSPIVMRSSGRLMNHPCQISEPINLSPEEPTESLPKPSSLLTRLTALPTRESSPLSSLSSSDPRIARPSDLSSSLSNKDTEIVEFHETTMDSSGPVIEVQPSVIITEEAEQIDPQLLNPHIIMDQAAAPPETPPRQSTASTQLPRTPVMAGKLAKLNMESPHLSPKNAKQIPQHERKTSKQKTMTILDIMKAADDDFQIGRDSLEESNLLLEPMVTRKQTNKHTVEKGAQAMRRTTNIRQPSDPAMCYSKIVKPNLKVSKRGRKLPKPNARQIQTNADSFSGASLQFSKSTAYGVGKSSSSHQRGVAMPKERDSFENTLNYAAFKDNNIVSVEGKDHPRHMREMTPIDTYDYMLADPWPTDPLSTDRVPGIWKAPQSKDEPRSKFKTTEVALQHRPRCLTSSSTSALSEVNDLHLKTCERPQIQKQTKESDITNLERKLEPLLLAQSPVVPKSELCLVSENCQITEQKPYSTTAVKSTEPKSAGMLFSKNNPRLPLPQSPDRLVSDRLIETPRELSPIRKPEDILFEFGRGRPLTRANLLSQDEIPSTSQETVLSFLNSQATQPSRPTPILKPSLLARQSRARSVSSTIACGVNGLRCGRKLCSNCPPRVVSQEEVDF